MRTLRVTSKDGNDVRDFTYADGREDEMERDRRDFLLAGCSVRERVTVSDGAEDVVLEAWPLQGAWVEVGRTPNDVGALYAPMMADGSAPTWDDVSEIAEAVIECGGWTGDAPRDLADFDSVDWTDPEVRAQLWADSMVLRELINAGHVDAETAAEVQLGLGRAEVVSDPVGYTDPDRPHPFAASDAGGCYLCGEPAEDVRHHRALTLSTAIAEIWGGVEDLGSLASALEPEDQLDEEEVAAGMRGREDRYRWTEANAVISTAFDRALRLADAAKALVVLDEMIRGGEWRQDWPDVVQDLRDAMGDFREAFGDYVPDAGAVRCVGCPCIEQGGSPCCYCGRDGDEHR